VVYTLSCMNGRLHGAIATTGSSRIDARVHGSNGRQSTPAIRQPPYKPLTLPDMVCITLAYWSGNASQHASISRRMCTTSRNLSVAYSNPQLALHPPEPNTHHYHHVRHAAYRNAAGRKTRWQRHQHRHRSHTYFRSYQRHYSIRFLASN